ncbi:MAG: two-component regulator propeller domain-containing protein, partial [Pseudomonadota bacterium]
MAKSADALSPDRLLSQYLYDRFSREDGLPADVIWDILQDDDGYLWLATQNGLVRFDGVRFVTFNNQNWPAFRSNDIRALCIDDNGNLVLGTYGGGMLRFDRERFTAVTSDDGLAHDVIYDLTTAQDGAIWLATGGGVSRWHEGRISNWTTADGLPS